MTTENAAPTIQKLGELEQQTRVLIENSNAAGFHGATIIEMIKGVMDIMDMEAIVARNEQKLPTFRTQAAAIAYQEHQKAKASS
jgi:hypothetical protein